MKKILNFIIGLIIIFSVNFLSAAILKTLKIPFPAPILGIIILFILLNFGIIKEKYIENFCNFILNYMVLFFIPLFVGIISYASVLAKNFMAIFMTILITTTLVMVVVGVSFEWIVKLRRLYKIKRSSK